MSWVLAFVNLIDHYSISDESFSGYLIVLVLQRITFLSIF